MKTKDINTKPAKRLKRFKGRLYYRTIRDGPLHHMARFDEKAVDQTKAERQVLDAYWDDRLDAADCIPVFRYD